ncbi:unnamed protein product [Fusarium graminearum]|nr:unnamed protein product [Fusarium graminearum]
MTSQLDRLPLPLSKSLLRAVPFILQDTPDRSLYRLVLEHGDYGIHNTTIAKQQNGEPIITSLFDWRQLVSGLPFFLTL